MARSERGRRNERRGHGQDGGRYHHQRVQAGLHLHRRDHTGYPDSSVPLQDSIYGTRRLAHRRTPHQDYRRKGQARGPRAGRPAHPHRPVCTPLRDGPQRPGPWDHLAVLRPHRHNRSRRVQGVCMVHRSVQEPAGPHIPGHTGRPAGGSRFQLWTQHEYGRAGVHPEGRGRLWDGRGVRVDQGYRGTRPHPGGHRQDAGGRGHRKRAHRRDERQEAGRLRGIRDNVLPRAHRLRADAGAAAPRNARYDTRGIRTPRPAQDSGWSSVQQDAHRQADVLL